MGTILLLDLWTPLYRL